ncbi:MAG: YIEGIA domain-containing protein [Clostridia bacterium]|nr:YIEGIA domain-containing protein [Clostridia bacterium]
MHASTLAIGLGVAAGLFERAYFLWADVRQFPTYPHNRVIHFFLGFVAAMLGALAVPAIATHNFIAGVFLAAGAQQFHAVRTVERRMLAELDRSEPVPRGPAYVEAIAMGFEARNYTVVLTSLATSFAAWLWGWPAGIATALAAVLVAEWVLGFPTVGEVATVEPLAPRVEGDAVVFGTARVVLPREAPVPSSAVRALRLSPRRPGDRLALCAPGQIQLILFEVAAAAGILHPGIEACLPKAHFDPGSASLIVTYVPADPEFDSALAAVRHAMLLQPAARRVRRLGRRPRV